LEPTGVKARLAVLLFLDPGQNLPETLVLDNGGRTDALQLVEGGITYKRRSKNHLMDQVESFRVGGRDSKRKDDLLDTFCYGIALALGDSKGF
jgi:hypothetical protein